VSGRIGARTAPPSSLATIATLGLTAALLARRTKL
jgi:hypothetical protein